MAGSGLFVLIGLKAAHLGRKVIRGDFTSAFLHVDSDEPFHTYYPKDHPDSLNGTMCMEWGKLLYGKGSAPRGLRVDIKTTLEAIGFVEEKGADVCLYTHPERDIDFGVYVDDTECSAEDHQLEWFQAQMNKRYEVKWLGTTTKNDPNSSEKSKIYCGTRTEVDPVTKIVTQNQTALIHKMAKQFDWDESKPRYNPPIRRDFPPLPNRKRTSRAIAGFRPVLELRYSRLLSNHGSRPQPALGCSGSELARGWLFQGRPRAGPSIAGAGAGAAGPAFSNMNTLRGL